MVCLILLTNEAAVAVEEAVHIKLAVQYSTMLCMQSGQAQPARIVGVFNVGYVQMTYRH